MQDTELYRHLLGIEKPWKVARVDLATKEQRVDVFVEQKPGEEFACPECGKKLGVYDHAEGANVAASRQLPVRDDALGEDPARAVS